jgi:hypothetical protein
MQHFNALHMFCLIGKDIEFLSPAPSLYYIRAFSMSSETVFGNFPVVNKAKSSVLPHICIQASNVEPFKKDPKPLRSI